MSRGVTPRSSGQRVFLRTILIAWILLGLACASIAVATSSLGLGVWTALCIALPVTLLYSLAQQGPAGIRTPVVILSSPPETVLVRSRWLYVVLGLILAETAIALLLWGVIVLSWDRPVSDKTFGFVLVAGALALVVVTIRSTAGHLSWGGIALSPLGVAEIRGSRRPEHVAWDGIRQVGPAMTNLPKRGDAVDLQTVDGTVRLSTADLSVGELEAMLTIRHYLTRPEHRTELGTEASLTRIAEVTATARRS